MALNVSFIVPFSPWVCVDVNVPVAPAYFPAPPMIEPVRQYGFG